MPDLAAPSALPTDLPLFAGVPREKVPHVLKCLNATLSTYRTVSYTHLDVYKRQVQMDEERTRRLRKRRQRIDHGVDQAFLVGARRHVGLGQKQKPHGLPRAIAQRPDGHAPHA